MVLEITSPMDYHVALYIRLSKEDESEGPSQSVRNQQSLLNGFAKQHGLLVYDTYIDDGWSGTTFERPDFQRMIADIEGKKVNMVITKDLSRLGRDYILTGHYMERYFPENRVRYISLLDGIDTGVDSTANDITPFRAIMNDMYAKDISKKIKSVKRDKQRKGQFIGGKPVYGYKMHPTEKNRIVIDEGAAPTVRRIFALALEGTSCRQIAVRLNEEKIPTPASYAGLTLSRHGAYSGLWSSERISDMLRNETYIGNMVQGRSIKVSYKTRKCHTQDRKDWIVVNDTHDPIVDKDVFERVQRLVASRKHTRSRTYEFLLKGIIVCHECGYPLAVMNRKSTKGADELYFVCRTYQRFTKAGACTCHAMKEKTLTEAVLARVQQDCKGHMNASELLSVAKGFVLETQREARGEKEVALMKARRESLCSHLDEAYMDKLEGNIGEDDFQRIYARIKAEREALEKRLSGMEQRDCSPAKQAKLAEMLVERFLESAFDNRDLLVSLIERVELTEEKRVIIRYRFQPLEGAG